MAGLIFSLQAFASTLTPEPPPPLISTSPLQIPALEAPLLTPQPFPPPPPPPPHDHWGDEIATTSLEYLLDFYAKKWGVAGRLPLIKKIVKCESSDKNHPGGYRFADNPKSTADGYFQFINSTWQTTMLKMGLPTSTSKFHETISVEAGVYLFAKEGAGHWRESVGCHGIIV